MTEHLRSRVKLAEEPGIFYLATTMAELGEDDWNSLEQLTVLHRFVGRNRMLLQEGEQVTRLRILCKGWAMRSLKIDEERRQILDFLIPGDVIGLHVDGRNCSLNDIEAITPCDVGEIDVNTVRRLALQSSGFALGMNRHLTRELAQATDQVVRLGRMTAYERLCGFLLNIYRRQRAALPLGKTVDFPITQTVVADALGLSVVHVNRQVMQLRREGLVSLNRRQLTIHDEARLAQLAGYHERHFASAPDVFVAAE